MISEASGRAWRGCQGIYRAGSFAQIEQRGSRSGSEGGAQSDYEEEIEEDRIFPRKVRRETCAKSAKPTIALFFRAAFVHLTMLQSTPACTVLRPPFLVLLSIVAPQSSSLSALTFFFLSPPRGVSVALVSSSRFHSNVGAILSHPVLFTPAIYPFADNKRRPPSPRSRSRRRLAQCAMHFCD